MKINDNWASGDVYEQFMGRWSRLVADQFVKWLDVPPRLTWIDLGCGTGALTDRIQRSAQPKFILGIEPLPHLCKQHRIDMGIMAARLLK